MLVNNQFSATILHKKSASTEALFYVAEFYTVTITTNLWPAGTLQSVQRLWLHLCGGYRLQSTC